MHYPTLQPIPSHPLWTEQFTGLDRRPRTYDGSFDAMGNMTGDQWPLLCSRKKRGIVAELENPLGMIAMEKLAWIDGSTLYYDGKPTPITNLSLDEVMLPKQMVSMGAYLLVFPDGVYCNTVNMNDSGSINRLYASPAGQSVSFSLCTLEGQEYPSGAMTVSANEPQNPAAGDYWLDTSGETHLLYRWNGEWTAVPSVYVRISAPGIGTGLKAQDGVAVSGVSYTGNNHALKAQLELLNNTHLVQAVGENYIVVTGVIDQNYTQTSGTIRADRKAPAMDFVIECNNRLWGCRYGEQDGEAVNQIYACALGDFTNWQKFAGTSQDSYFVHLGSDGPFTGAAAHRGTPCFFKENCLHRIYGEIPANFQMQTAQCEGVNPGSGGTLVSAGGAMYYLGAHGVQRFDGLPDGVSKALGQDKLSGGAAGIMDGRYYLSVEEAGDGWSLYVLDTEKGAWHRQDNAHALAFAPLGGEMYMLCRNGTLYALNGTAGTPEPDEVTWYAETAEMGYDYPEHQYLSRFLLRMKLDTCAECRFLVQYDSDGIWLERGTLRGNGRTNLLLMPIVPRRCQHMKVRLEGSGGMQLYGMARVLSAGSDGGLKP